MCIEFIYETVQLIKKKNCFKKSQVFEKYFQNYRDDNNYSDDDLHWSWFM